MLAILKDSFRETLDCKTFWILLAVSTLLIGLAFSVSFAPVGPDDALTSVVRGFNRIPVARTVIRHDVDFAASEVKEDGKGGYEFRLLVSPVPNFHKLIRQWDAASRGLLKKAKDPVPDLEAPADVELQRSFLVSQLRFRQLLRVSVEPEPPAGESLSYRVSARPERPELLHGGHRVNVLFGAFSAHLPVSAALVLAGIQSTVGGGIAGFVGFLIAVIVTGSFVPDMLQKGRIDVVLSRPIGRGSLLLSKYLGGLIFVFLNAAYLVGGVWLGLAVRSGNWSPAFLLTIPVLTLIFAVFYAFSVWVSVLTRGTLASILCTIALWVSTFSAGQFHAKAKDPQRESVFPAAVEKLIEGIYTLLPKTYDLSQANSAVILRSQLGDEAVATLPSAMAVDTSAWPIHVASSLLILGVFLVCAVIVFRRRDY
jgi:ABC-type transport system involved in multi-copper enzyme maturation permease subunit